MNHQLICTWLGISDAAWPPDHYRLLGLEPGEGNIDRIEEQVHQRLEGVRRYQITHPDLVTEAMNRLAQAFVCLTDPAAKQAYDLELLGHPAPASNGSGALAPQRSQAVQILNKPSEELVAIDHEPDNRDGDPVEAEDEEPLIPLLPAEAVSSGGIPASAAAENQSHTGTAADQPAFDATPPDIVIPEGLPPQAATLPTEKVDPAAAEASATKARRGIGTKRTLYFRIARTRKLLDAWDRAGKYLAEPQRRITRPAEATELIKQLARIQSLLRGFPPVLGEAGQPGYLVAALARQPAPVPMFQTLLPSQRDSLAQHWEAGRKFLVAHRQFLRQEVQARRRRSRVSRAVRTLASLMSDYPEYVLFALATLALTFALTRVR
jgi:hypothetical protein